MKCLTRGLKLYITCLVIALVKCTFTSFRYDFVVYIPCLCIITMFVCSTSRIEYGHFDILQDEEVRQGLKKFSDWPTYPQIYVNGELIGGLDILKVRVIATSRNSTDICGQLFQIL